MKKEFCRYAVVEVETGCLLVCGQKWKNFANTPIGNLPIVKLGTFRCFPLLWREITEYFRDVEIKGRHCVIVYWVHERAKRGKLYNVVQRRGWSYFCLRGRQYSLDKTVCYDVYRRLLESLGVS